MPESIGSVDEAAVPVMPVCPQCQESYDEDLEFCGRCGSAMGRPASASSANDSWIGQVIDGRYRVLARIGQGGMGAVYRVEHLRMGKIAAMKVLLQELASDRELIKRFRREAEAVSRLTHPNSVQTFDFGQVGDALFLVMEYLRGENLSAILKRDGPLLFQRVAPIVIQVCSALAEAHELGIVHRDLKPENIMVSRTKDGADYVKVLDFGLAKMRESEALNDITQRGCLIGTPYYMSPEQVRSEDPDARSDVYSLGAVMYRMLAGVEPFSGVSPMAVLTKHLTDEPVPPRQRRPDLDIDPGAEAIVLRAMAKRREDRYQSIDAMREEIERRRLELAGIPASAAASYSGPLVLTPVPSPDKQRRASDGRPILVTPAPPPETPPDGSLDATLPDVAPAGERLSREDFNQYERRLRRQRYSVLFVPVGLIAAGVLVWYFGFHRAAGRVPGEESEPNNEPAQANPLASGKPVRGQIGKRLNREQSDRDFFRIPRGVRPDEGRTVSARVSGIPNMDLTLELYDTRGQRIAHGDGAGPGGPEALPNVHVDGQEYYLCVREVWVSGRPPTENVTDQYVLQADWAPVSKAEEVEPNDSAEAATPLPIGGSRRGYLGRRADVDHYRVTGTAGGIIAVEVSGVQGVILRLRGWQPARPSRDVDARLADAPRPGITAESPGAGQPVHLSVPWPDGTPAPVVSVEATGTVADGGAAAQDAYTIQAKR
ncbi:MAG: serine/threonine protein kinase [Deltaproteobacteria bacterium]|nr:serine/threonine protein kinase [Deltaproteobacteria bacterium]